MERKNRTNRETLFKATVFKGASATCERILDEETERDYVTTYKLKSGETGTVIDIKVPELQKILIRGDIDALAVRLADKDNNDIRWSNKIQVIKKMRNREEIVICELIYSDINAQKIGTKDYKIIDREYEEYFRFKKDVNTYIGRGEYLKIRVISPDRDIETINLLLDVIIGIF